MPATAQVLCPLILEVLSECGGLLESKVLRAKVVTKLHARNFSLQPQSHAFREALYELKKDGLVQNPRMGWYGLAADQREVSKAAADSGLGGLDESEQDEVFVGAGGDDEGQDEDARQTRIKPLRVIGTGPESVYVYYHDVYEHVAKSSRQATWECKVGWTNGEADERIIGQGALTAFPTPPIIGIVIKTNDGRHLERILHAALKYAGKRLEVGGGSEWFRTSPEQVERWYTAFCASVKLLNDEEQENRPETAAAGG